MVHDFDKIWKSYCRLIFSNQILHAYTVWCAWKRGCIFFFRFGATKWSNWRAQITEIFWSVCKPKCVHSFRWHHSLGVTMLRYEARGQGSNPGTILLFSNVIMIQRNLKFDFRLECTLMNPWKYFQSFSFAIKYMSWKDLWWRPVE